MSGSSPETDNSHVTSGPILDDFTDIKCNFSCSLTSYRGNFLRVFCMQPHTMSQEHLVLLSR